MNMETKVKHNCRPKRKCFKTGKSLYWYVVDIYETEDKKELLKREIYRQSWQIVSMHPDAFKNPEQVRMIVKRHTFSDKVGFSAKTPPKRRRMKIYRKVVSPKVLSTADHLLVRSKSVSTKQS